MNLPLVKPPILRDQVQDVSWQDWRWQLRNMLVHASDFDRVVKLSDDERAGLASSPGIFRVGATPYYASLMDPDNPDCPIRRQSIPSARELDFAPEELRDPPDLPVQVALVSTPPHECSRAVVTRADPQLSELPFPT